MKIDQQLLGVSILVLTLVFGISASYADYKFANQYRNFVSIVPEAYGTSTNQIWFSGGAGFEYYMLEKGYKIMQTEDNSMKKGDVFIVPEISFPRKIATKLLERSRLVATVVINDDFPVRTQNPEARAGHYTYAGGLLPFSFSNAALETYRIYEVEK